MPRYSIAVTKMLVAAGCCFQLNCFHGLSVHLLSKSLSFPAWASLLGCLGLIVVLVMSYLSLRKALHTKNFMHTITIILPKFRCMARLTCGLRRSHHQIYVPQQRSDWHTDGATLCFQVILAYYYLSSWCYRWFFTMLTPMSTKTDLAVINRL